MNTDIAKGKWNELKGELQKNWGRITDDEWEKTKGDAKSISGLVQQRYGEGKEDISDKVSSLFQKYVSNPVKNALRDEDEGVDENYNPLKREVEQRNENNQVY